MIDKPQIVQTEAQRTAIRSSALLRASEGRVFRGEPIEHSGGSAV
jgi:hypothetical protein